MCDPPLLDTASVWHEEDCKAFVENGQLHVPCGDGGCVRLPAMTGF